MAEELAVDQVIAVAVQLVLGRLEPLLYRLALNRKRVYGRAEVLAVPVFVAEFLEKINRFGGLIFHFLYYGIAALGNLEVPELIKESLPLVGVQLGQLIALLEDVF